MVGVPCAAASPCRPLHFTRRRIGRRACSAPRCRVPSRRGRGLSSPGRGDVDGAGGPGLGRCAPSPPGHEPAWPSRTAAHTPSTRRPAGASRCPATEPRQEMRAYVDAAGGDQVCGAVGQPHERDLAGVGGVGQKPGAVQEQVDGVPDVLGDEVGVLSVPGSACGEHPRGHPLDHVSHVAAGRGAVLHGGARGCDRAGTRRGRAAPPGCRARSPRTRCSPVPPTRGRRCGLRTVAQPTVEDDFGRQAGVGAAEHHGERALGRRSLSGAQHPDWGARGNQRRTAHCRPAANASRGVRVWAIMGLRLGPHAPGVGAAGSGQPREEIRSLHACSQRRQASAHTRQWSCWPAWRSHSSPQALQTVAHAWRIARVTLAS